MSRLACLAALAIIVGCVNAPFNPNLFALDARGAPVPVMLTPPRRPVAPGRPVTGTSTYVHQTDRTTATRNSPSLSYVRVRQSRVSASESLLQQLEPKDHWLQCTAADFTLSAFPGRDYSVRTTLTCEAQR